MTSIGKKPAVSAILLLLLTGIFLACESGRLFFDFRWKQEGVGIFAALCAIEMIAGFLFVNKRKMTDFLYISCALLLTLHAGVINTTLNWVINFAFAGGITAFLVRNRKTNTYFPFAVAFAAGLILVFALPDHALLLSFISGMLLTGMLIVSASGLNHVRWIFLTLIVIQAFLFPAGKNRIKAAQHYRDIHDVVISTLPASLLTENDSNNLSVLQVTRNKHLKEIAPWHIIPGIGEKKSCLLEEFPPAGIQLDMPEKTFDIVSVEILPGNWSDSAVKTLLEKLSKMVEEKHGIMIFPRSVIEYMPKDKVFITVPGSEKRRLAAVGYPPEKVTTEQLDKRLQKILESTDNKDFMTPGVFEALFNEKIEKINCDVKKNITKQHSVLFWITLAFFWFIFRITASRKGKNSAFLAAMDNTSSATLIALTGFCVFAENRIYACFPEMIFLTGIIFALPFFGKKGKLEKILILCSMILPWIFTDPEPGTTLVFVIFLPLS